MPTRRSRTSPLALCLLGLALCAHAPASARGALGQTSGRQTGQTGSDVKLDFPAASTLRPRRPGEEQVRGLLTRIECAGATTILHVRAGERELRLRGGDLERIKFVSYVRSVGEITCGPRKRAEHVLATYKPSTAGPGTPPAPDKKRPAPRRPRRPPALPPKADGEIIEIDFIPADWK